MPRHPRGYASLCCPLALLLCLVPAHGQSSVTSPPGYSSTEGQGVAAFLGAFPTMRFQMVDGELRNRSMTMKAIGFRWENIHGGQAPGRSFTNVSLDVGFANFDSFGNVFSANFLRTPARVFRGPVKWATGWRVPNGQPAPWRSDLRFPFRTSVVVSGREDLCLDFQFAGGSLANGLAWTHAHKSYLLDSYYGGLAGYTFHKPQPPIGKSSCIDSKYGSRWTATAQAILQCFHYGGQEPNPSLRNKLVVYGWGDLLGPGSKAFHLLGIAGSASGIPFPSVTCGKLHVAPTQPFWIQPDTASAFGGVNFHPIGRTWTAANAAWAGVPLWYQIAWHDSKTGALQLSRASESSIPVIPPPRRRATTYRFGNPTPDGQGPVINTSATSPIYRVEL